MRGQWCHYGAVPVSAPEPSSFWRLLHSHAESRRKKTSFYECYMKLGPPYKPGPSQGFSLPLLLVRGSDPGFLWSSFTKLWFFTAETDEGEIEFKRTEADPIATECHFIFQGMPLMGEGFIWFAKIGSTMTIQWINCFNLAFMQPEYGYGI